MISDKACRDVLCAIITLGFFWMMYAICAYLPQKTVTETRFYPIVDFEAYKRGREEDAKRWLLLNQRLERIEKKGELPTFGGRYGK